MYTPLIIETIVVREGFSYSLSFTAYWLTRQTLRQVPDPQLASNTKTK